MKGVRRTVSAVFKRTGHTVTEADDGGAGLQLLQGSQRFDLVITDVLMDVLLYLEQRSDRPQIRPECRVFSRDATDPPRRARDLD